MLQEGEWQESIITDYGSQSLTISKRRQLMPLYLFEISLFSHLKPIKTASAAAVLRIVNACQCSSHTVYSQYC